MNKVRLGIAPMLLLVTSLSGCSISASVSNSIESSLSVISSPFTSSSSMSEEATLVSDTAEYTDAFVSSKKTDMEAYRHGIAKVANSYGVSNWEEDVNSWTGIGRGLKEANLDEAEALGFIALLKPTDLQEQLILDGYRADD